MKKLLTTVCLMGLAALLIGEEVELWRTKLPGFRKAYDISKLPEKLFAAKTEVGAVIDTGDSETQALIDRLSSLTVTGLMWSNVRAERRVLMGDIVMREGQSIPSYIFGDGQYYVLKEILKDRLRFVLGNIGNPNSFEVPFGLKDPLKNESRFGQAIEPGKDVPKPNTNATPTKP